MESNMRQVTVLVVEDNYTVFALIKTALTTYPKQDGYYYCVAHASDGVYGLEQVWRLHPDIVLLDIHLPRLNGYEVLQSLRSGRNTTPVIMMTASAEKSERHRAFQAGCNAFVSKPLKPSSLHRYIQEVLQVENNTDTKRRMIKT